MSDHVQKLAEAWTKDLIDDEQMIELNQHSFIAGYEARSREMTLSDEESALVKMLTHMRANELTREYTILDNLLDIIQRLTQSTSEK